jgi:hypothetical protein
LVGTAENLSTPGVVTVSKYFAGREKGKVKDSGNDDTEEKGRKTPLRSRPTLYYQEEGGSTGNIVQGHRSAKLNTRNVHLQN